MSKINNGSESLNYIYLLWYREPGGIEILHSQLINSLGIWEPINKFQHNVHYYWILFPEMKIQYELLRIECLSIREVSRESRASSKFKTQTDTKISIDIIKKLMRKEKRIRTYYSDIPEIVEYAKLTKISVSLR